MSEISLSRESLAAVLSEIQDRYGLTEDQAGLLWAMHVESFTTAAAHVIEAYRLQPRKCKKKNQPPKKLMKLIASLLWDTLEPAARRISTQKLNPA